MPGHVRPESPGERESAGSSSRARADWHPNTQSIQLNVYGERGQGGEGGHRFVIEAMYGIKSISQLYKKCRNLQ